MAGYDCLPMKMKRKDFDRVNDDFSDFSLSSPARKIRRLDLDLPPIMEEEEIQSAPRNISLQDLDLPTILEEEETQSAPVNEERAIVLFKPPQHHYQPQVFVDRNLISGFKNRYLHNAALEDGIYDDDEKTNKNQALVCWDPSQFQFLESTGTVWERQREPEIVELDGEDTMMEDAAMDVEEGNSGSVSQPQPQQLVGGSYQWQHCMVPELPQTKSTPISWFR